MALNSCLCCFQTRFLNNSGISHCFLQLFLPGDPPESQETTQAFVSVCAATVCACVLCSILYSFLHVAPYLGNCICPAPPEAFFCQACPFHCGAKLKPVLREPGLDSVRSCCLMCHPWPQAMKWRGSYAQQPWPESALLHNSDCLCFTLVSFVLFHEQNRKQSAHVLVNGGTKTVGTTYLSSYSKIHSWSFQAPAVPGPCVNTQAVLVSAVVMYHHIITAGGREIVSAEKWHV